MNMINSLKKVFTDFLSRAVMPEVLNPASSDFPVSNDWIPAQRTAGMTDNMNLGKNRRGKQ